MHRSIIKTIIIIVMCVFVAKFGLPRNENGQSFALTDNVR